MQIKTLQGILGVVQDGIWGPQTFGAFIDSFINRQAPAITEDDYRAAAKRLGCSLAQIKAFAKIESGGGGFSRNGRPKILFEAHIFSRLTGGKYNRSHPTLSSHRWTRKFYARHMPGRYARLASAAKLDIEAAIGAASWGKFQILGSHWRGLGYKSAWDFAQKMVVSEANHLEAFCRYIEKNKLKTKLRKARADNPDSCRAVVRAYNGPAYEKNRYHIKLAYWIGRYKK